MVIYFGADHRGFQLKEILKVFIHDMGYEVVDLGAEHLDETDDYPDFAAAVAKKISGGDETVRGIVICGSGVGADVTANRFSNVRSALAISPDQIYSARHDDNVNVLSLAASFMDEETAKKIVNVFLSTPFGKDDRFQRRINKIERATEN